MAEILRKLKLQEGATSSRSPPGSGLLPTGRPEPFSRKKAPGWGWFAAAKRAPKQSVARKRDSTSKNSRINTEESNLPSGVATL